MGGHITFAGVPITYIVDSVDVNKTLQHRDSPFIGQKGADLQYVSTDNKVISFESLCPMDEPDTEGTGLRILEYINLSEIYAEQAAQLRSESVAIPAGNYMITSFKFKEDTGGNFRINWEFTELAKFNVTQKTFRVWNKAQALKNAKKTTTKKTKGLNSNTKKLLKDCPLMKKGNKGKCVRVLQIFLQSQGYYTKGKVDGDFGSLTEKAVKSLQKKIKVKVTGKWDKATLKYFQKKFNYPDLLEKSNKKLSKLKGPILKGPISRKPYTLSRKRG